MKPIKEMSQAELAAFVQNHLRSKEIVVILSGGAVVAIYTKGLYVTKDIDLVNVHFTQRQKIVSAMEEIGFFPVGRHFQHPDSDHVIEFPSGPLTIGSEKVSDINEIELQTGKLFVLSPIDCIKDRLSHYYHWGDQQCLIQAKMIASNYTIAIEDIRDWSYREGMEKIFEKIQRLLWPKNHG